MLLLPLRNTDEMLLAAIALLMGLEQPLATCLFNRSLVSLITLTVAVFEQNWDQTSVEPASSRKAFHPLKSGVQMLFSARFHWC